MIGATKPVYVIADGCSIHKSVITREGVGGLNGQLKLNFFSTIFIAAQSGRAGGGSRVVARVPTCQQSIFFGS
jgi:hypothetical protein